MHTFLLLSEFLLFSEFLFQHVLFVCDEFEVVDAGVGLLDLLVGAFEVEGECVFPLPELGLVLLEGGFDFLVGGLPGWYGGYIWCLSLRRAWRSD